MTERNSDRTSDIQAGDMVRFKKLRVECRKSGKPELFQRKGVHRGVASTHEHGEAYFLDIWEF